VNTKNAQRTDWFTGDCKPAHVGWYEVKAAHGHQLFHNGSYSGGAIVKRYWDGKTWLWQPSPRAPLRYAAVAPVDFWRGLVR
jgi:hypothetical protein